jgi:hypothetical protein
MGEPTAPVLPQDAPQDVKDFFDCKGDKLEWKKGKVDWLGLPLSPEISFEHGKAQGSIDITINFPVIPKFTVNASVNDAGELVVDTTNIPDLSDYGLPNLKKSVDDAVANINGWFKKNGKKLKKATYRKGVVTLEKTAIQTAYVPPLQAPTATVALAAYEPQQRSMTPMLLMILISVVVLGLLTGYLVFGGNGQGGVANASPTPKPTATASASPTPSPTPTPSATPSATAEPTPTAAPTPSPTSSLQAYISGVCARVKHSGFGNFVSYIDWVMYWDGFDVDHFVLAIEGTNDDAPVILRYDPAGGDWTARLGLHAAGDKTITQLVAILADGTPIDITDALVELLQTDVLSVRYPQEDTFGVCFDVN